MKPSSSQGRKESLTEQRHKRFFIVLEVLTVLFAITGIGLQANVLDTLGGISFHMERYGLAEALLRDALWVQEKLHGPGSLALIEPLNDLAYFYYDADENDKAALAAERSIAICQANLGPRDPRRAWTLSVASLVYDGTGNFVKAERMANEALPILEGAAGKQSWQVASTLNRLGLALEGEGRLPEAEVALRRSLAIREGFGGANWDGLVPILHNLSRVYNEQGKEKEANASRQRAETIKPQRQ